MTKPTRDPYYSSSFERGLRVLRLFAEGQADKRGLSEISRELGMNKTISYRFVNTLLKLGYLEKDEGTRKYSLALKAFVLGQNLAGSFDVVQIVRPMIDDAFDKYNCSMDVALLDGDVLEVVYRREVKDTLTFHAANVITELHSNALGKAALAYMGTEDVERIVQTSVFTKRTASTLIKKELLLADLEHTRARGFSLNNEELIPGLISIGAPLLSTHSHRSIGSISFDFSTIEHSIRSVQKEFSTIIVELAANISQMLPVRYR